MKNYLNYIILLLSVIQCNSQIINNEDYTLLNEVIPNFLNIKESDKVSLYETTLEFKNQDMIFEESFFKEYIYVPLGKGGIKKIKKIMKGLDFEYLKKQNREISTWDFKKLKFPFNKYIASERKSESYQLKRCSISLPIYSKDKKFAFIYYEHVCESLDCGATSLTIYKRIKNKWVWYLNIPILLA